MKSKLTEKPSSFSPQLLRGVSLLFDANLGATAKAVVKNTEAMGNWVIYVFSMGRPPKVDCIFLRRVQTDRKLGSG